MEPYTPTPVPYQIPNEVRAYLDEELDRIREVLLALQQKVQEIEDQLP